jgi:hypothetical protein
LTWLVPWVTVEDDGRKMWSTCNAETQLRYRLGSQFIRAACDFYLFEQVTRWNA